MCEFKAVASDGQWTIGYDADGVAGFIEGNMADTFQRECDFHRVREGYEFVEGGGAVFVAQTEYDNNGNQVIVWNEVK